MTILEDRVAKLEKSNRQLRAGLVLAILVAGVCCFAAAKRGDEIQDAVRAKKFELCDANGMVRGTWDTNAQSPDAFSTLQMTSPSGNATFKLQLLSTQASWTMEAGEDKAQLPSICGAEVDNRGARVFSRVRDKWFSSDDHAR
jgi:hypothetical protein